MLLAVNVGNTNINIGLFKESRLVKRHTIAWKKHGIGGFFKKIISANKLVDAILCSVVPDVSDILAKELKALLGKRPYILGKDIRVPIKNLYRNPSQTGQDRLLNAYTAAVLYGAPLIAIDFGTAITFDVVSGKKEYLGGMILPGLEISLDALYQKTALLPRIKLDPPTEFIGRDTKNSILSGIVYGFAGLTDDLVQKIKNKIGKGARVIATGGNSRLLAKYCYNIDKIDNDLTLKGLNLLYRFKNI